MIRLNKITHIRNKVPLGTPIIVEGKKDKKVLEKIGFKNIIPISGKSNIKILKFLQKKKYDKVAILTDFDKEGKKKCKELTHILQRNGIRIDSFVRKTFNHTFKIHKIEELSSFTKLIEDDYYGKDTQIYEKSFNRNRFIKRRKKAKQT